MRLIERHIFLRIGLVFVLTIGILTAVVWSTQALRRLDLVTAHGQTLWFFLKMTLLALPSLIVVVAPFALMIAVITTLNAMTSDSELVVVGSAGGSRWIILRPILLFAVLLGFLLLVLSAETGPAGRRQMRTLLTEVRVDVIANVLRPGRFTEIDDGLTFHVANRRADGVLEGIVLNDERDAKVRFAYLADRGQVVEALGKTLLIMQDGTIQRRMTQTQALSIIAFQSYAFDLTQLAPTEIKANYKPTERSLFELLSPDTTQTRWIGRFRAELHDRLVQPLFPIAFVLLVFVMLGDPRTYRQGRSLGIGLALVGCISLRMISFSAINVTAKSASGALLVYAPPILVIICCLALVAADRRLAPPASWRRAFESLSEKTTGALSRFRRTDIGSGAAGS